MNSPFPSYYEEFIHISRYARWRDEDNRRETWEETVNRLLDYYHDRVCELVGEAQPMNELHEAIYNLEVMPSMRALMTAGPALDRCNVAAYNCAYLPVDDVRAFDETMYILMCGTGVGFSVERKYTDKLPEVAEELQPSGITVVVEDSKEGWAKALRQFLSLLYSGSIPRWDVSKLRPKGSRLKTFGGRASGPEPLVDLFRFTVELFKRAEGRKLTSLECHDLMCRIAGTVVVGGVRRSAMISLSDINDERMRSAKTGEWYLQNKQRRVANNSAVYERHKPDVTLFMKEWLSLVESKSGERGIFSRYACQAIAGRNGRRDPDYEFGTNPCSEIILRPFQFCNLSEIVVRPDDTFENLKRKARLAAILGTIQATFTKFRYLRKIWKHNCEEERLLGVSLTGICDREILSDACLEELKEVVIQTNKEWSELLGIPQATACTCVKPSGTVSQLVNAASGMHRRHAPYYLRRVRADSKDPLTQFMISIGIPNEVDFMDETNIVFTFPVKSPDKASIRGSVSAVEELELWKRLQDHWCEHKPSATVNVKDEEWVSVGAWVFENFDYLSGVSFLPYDGGTYMQMPYEEISKEEYKEWTKKMPANVDWSGLKEFESEDHTTGSQEFACTGGLCEVVMIGDVGE